MTKRHKCPRCNFNKSYKIRRGKVTLLGIAAKGYVHRLVEHQKGKYTDKHGSHINGLEGFWGYLKRKLASSEGRYSQGKVAPLFGSNIFGDTIT